MAYNRGSVDGGDDDWRSQVDSLYSGSEYNDLISLSSKVNRAPDLVAADFSFRSGGDPSQKQVFDAIRFPPVSAVSLPDELYKQYFEQSFELRSSFKKQCPEDDESMAALDFLENMLPNW